MAVDIKLRPSGIWRRAVWLIISKVSEKLAVSIFYNTLGTAVFLGSQISV